jgi:hypothetical protein
MIYSPLAATATDLAAKPAGGAALDQVAIATGGATIVTLVLLWLVSGHRSGKTPWLGRAAGFAARKSGLPAWAALPTAIAAVSLNVALLGMYWDIALHIDLGRDEGPLANPAHSSSSPASTASSPPARWPSRCPARRAPRPRRPAPERRLVRAVGGVLMAACGGFALIGFPLDDMWHRLFGQDVTLWGPTHLMLIGGAG